MPFYTSITHSIYSAFVCCGSNRRITENQDSFNLDRIGFQRPDSPKDTSLEKTNEEISTSLEKSYSVARVEFRIKFRTNYGQQMKIVGSHSQFGSWSISRCPAMKWSDGDVWRMTLFLPVAQIYEYKYVVVNSNSPSVVLWQQGNNCVLAISAQDKELQVGDNWSGSPGATVASKGRGISTKEERLMDWAREMRASSGNNKMTLKQKRLLERAQEEQRIARQEATRLKSELRMAAMSRQVSERQVKELQQENRRLLSIVMEQKTIHKNIMEQTLQLLSEQDPVLETKTESSKNSTADETKTGSSDKSPVLETKTGSSKNCTVVEKRAGSSKNSTVDERRAGSSEDLVETSETSSPDVISNGSAPLASSKNSKSRRRKFNRRRKKRRPSTKTAAVSS